MTDIASLLQSLPAGTEITILTARLPDGHRQVIVPEPRNDSPVADPRLALVSRRFTEDDATPRTSHDTAGSLSIDSEATPIDHVRRIKASEPTLRMKSKEWAKRIGCSARELTRAVELEALQHQVKEDGRDHGAKTVGVSDLEEFLVTVDAVERGQMTPPKWWNGVRGPRAWVGRHARGRAA